MAIKSLDTQEVQTIAGLVFAINNATSNAIWKTYDSIMNYSDKDKRSIWWVVKSVQALEFNKIEDEFKNVSNKAAVD